MHTKKTLRDFVYRLSNVRIPLSLHEFEYIKNGVEAVRDLIGLVGDDEHPENQCQRCKGRNIVWHTADYKTWKEVVGASYQILCPICFAELAREKGVGPQVWCLLPSNGREEELRKDKEPPHESTGGEGAIAGALHEAAESNARLLERLGLQTEHPVEEDGPPLHCAECGEKMKQGDGVWHYGEWFHPACYDLEEADETDDEEPLEMGKEKETKPEDGPILYCVECGKEIAHGDGMTHFGQWFHPACFKAGGTDDGGNEEETRKHDPMEDMIKLLPWLSVKRTALDEMCINGTLEISCFGEVYSFYKTGQSARGTYYLKHRGAEYALTLDSSELQHAAPVFAREIAREQGNYDALTQKESKAVEAILSAIEHSEEGKDRLDRLEQRVNLLQESFERHVDRQSRQR